MPASGCWKVVRLSLTASDGSPVVAHVGPEQELPLLRAHFPQAQLKTVPQAGHWVHAEQPEAFSRTVMDFLQTIPAPTEPGNS
jgi:pimeloyl-ACP methyl ester carboxylesterase